MRISIKVKTHSKLYFPVHLTQNGWTALKHASISGHGDVVELLLSAGADPNVQDKVKLTMSCDI